MRIQKVTEEELDYVSAICLDPSIGKKNRHTMQKGMTARIRWIKQMLPKGLEIFIALEKPKLEKIKYKWAGEILHADLAVHGWVPKGLLESVPIEYALEPVTGKKCLFIHCIWILPPFWHTGVAKKLVEAFLQNAQQVGGASVLAYEGDKWFDTSIKYMPASFFERFGFEEVARDRSRVLLFLDLGIKEPPKLLSPKTKRYYEKDKITIDVLFNSQCP
ncbi:MAG: GNAT family N-acetyltransferase [Candidatus Heimdallarchaeota archaeon]